MDFGRIIFLEFPLLYSVEKNKIMAIDLAWFGEAPAEQNLVFIRIAPAIIRIMQNFLVYNGL